MNWYKKPLDEVFNDLQASEKGLSEKQVKARQKQYGKNILPEMESISWLKIVFHQIHSPLIYLLLIAAIISCLVHSWNDAIVIMLVIFVNSLLGAYQEWSAEQSSLSLQELLVVMARVRRNGSIYEVAAQELVPGDIVIVEAGMRVPADMRLIEVHNLLVDQSFLTGESQACEKSLNVSSHEAIPAEQENMIFAGSTITRGLATGVVVATGTSSQVGQIAVVVSRASREDTPLMIRLGLFARHISFVVLACCMVIVLVGFLTGSSPRELFSLATALLVAAIPEGLPIAVTVALSIGSQRMAQRKVIVRRLAAVEALGSCSCIATDKTGTLTVNKQTIVRIVIPQETIFEVSGEGYNDQGALLYEGKDCAYIPQDVHDLALAGFLCNQSYLFKENGSWRFSGDDVDLAFNALGLKMGMRNDEALSSATVLFHFPFDEERRCAATVYADNGVTYVVLKGAAEEVLARCSSMQVEGKCIPLNEKKMWAASEKLAADGYRVLAVARAQTDDGLTFQKWKDIDQIGYSLLGFVGLIDPVRKQVPHAVRTCGYAGIRVIMVTGDHPQTALTIARQIGIAQDNRDVITGSELDGDEPPDEHLLIELVNTKTVFARVTPAQKVSIVEACKKAGHFVAVTGDGVNDAPALKIAHLGIAMGSGTDSAKQASLAVITDDNFASIVAGIEEGRIAYSNIRKVLFLLTSTAVAQIACILVSMVSGLPLPLIPLQLLWLNLVTNGIQDLALACEPGEPQILSQSNATYMQDLFDWRMFLQVVISGGLMSVVGLSAWFFLVHSDYNIQEARNLFFLLFVLMLNAHVLNTRSERLSLFFLPFFSNTFITFGLVGAQMLHIVCMYIPFMQRLLVIAPISLLEWLALLSVALMIIPLVEVTKSILNYYEKHLQKGSLQ